MSPIDYPETPELKGVILASVGTPTYPPTLTVQRGVVEAQIQGHRVVASLAMAKVDPVTGRRFPRVYCSRNPKSLPSKAYISSEARIVELTPWPIEDIFIFVEER